MESVIHPFLTDGRWSSNDVPAALALCEWNHVLSTQVVDMEVTKTSPEFSLAWRRFGLGSIDLNFYNYRPLTVYRTEKMTGSRPDRTTTLILARRGPIDFVHLGKTWRTAEGNFGAVDESRPYTLAMPNGGDCLTVRMPESWLHEWVGEPDSLLGYEIDGKSGWAHALRAILNAISDCELRDIGLPRPVIASQIGGMVSLIAGSDVDNVTVETSLLRAVKGAIAARFQQPQLTPAAIANSLGISSRHLHRVLAQAGTCYSEVLWRHRVLQAFTLLRDRKLFEEPIGNIAWLCGFVDSGHFSRKFKAHTGLTPTEFRARCQN